MLLHSIFHFSWFSIFLSAIFGAIFGSFSTFLGYRLFNEDKNINLTGSRSVCYNCGHKLSLKDLVPIFSFFILNGKCRYCKKNIPIWYILAEVLMVFSFIIAVEHFEGINKNSILMWIICFCLITQSIIDCRVMMSSDVLHIIEFCSVFTLSYNEGTGILSIIIGYIVVILLFLLLLAAMKKIFKKNCLGLGDIKLFAILSPFFLNEKMPIFLGLCGAFGIVFYFFFHYKKLSFLLKSENKEDEDAFPFIPSIFFAFLLAFYF